MRPEGWILLVSAWSIILWMTVFCFVEIFKKGAGMRRKPLIFVCLCVISIMCSGCATLLLGVAAGG